jgi:hypothetical protein
MAIKAKFDIKKKTSTRQADTHKETNRQVRAVEEVANKIAQRKWGILLST